MDDGDGNIVAAFHPPQHPIGGLSHVRIAARFSASRRTSRFYARVCMEWIMFELSTSDDELRKLRKTSEIDTDPEARFLFLTSTHTAEDCPASCQAGRGLQRSTGAPRPRPLPQSQDDQEGYAPACVDCDLFTHSQRTWIPYSNEAICAYTQGRPLQGQGNDLLRGGTLRVRSPA